MNPDDIQKLVESLWDDYRTGNVEVDGITTGLLMDLRKALIDDDIENNVVKCDTCYHKKYHEEDVSRRIVKYD